MTEVIYHHHPDDQHLSIVYSSPNFEEIEQRRNRYSELITDVLQYDLDQPVYVLYAGSPPPGAADEVDVDPDELVGHMSRENRQITTNLLQAFIEIIEEKENEEEEKLRAYKELEADGIPSALSQVDWTGTVAEVGGRLMSSLILKHSFPNANHRTSLVLLERYIKAHEFDFLLPRMHDDDYNWQGWADRYIRQSKRLLTLRRNAPRFYYLWREGCDTVERKGDIQITLGEHELITDVNSAHSHYAEKHVKLCQRLAEEIMDRQGHSDLLDAAAMSKHQFADRMSEMP